MAHYVNNKEFLAALIERKQLVLEAEEAGEPKPQISKYIGECILKIATHLSYKPNFINYTYKDDMILDGIENCIQYIDNFDPAKSSNPFAYFTQIIYFAFLRRIATEKKQSYIKNKLIKEMPFDSFDIQQQDEDGHFHNAYVDYIQSNQNSDLDDYFERKAAKKVKKKQSQTLDDFIEGDLNGELGTGTDPISS
jgi:hypothetical protein